jgi:hypothetical protein
MPIEIKELIIKATVSTENRRAVTGGGAKAKRADTESDNVNVQKIINEVFSKIKNKEER